MIKKGDEVLADVLELNSEGKGVSKLDDGFVIFSAGTLPDDLALLKIAKKRSSYAEAKLIEIKRNSAFRIDPVCSYFGVCGGCKIQNLQYNKQLEFKTNVVKNAFERIGGFKNLLVPYAIKSDQIFFYRNKMEFSFSDDEWLTIPPLDSIVTSEKHQELIPPYPLLQGGNIQVSEDNRVTSEKDQGLILPYPPLQRGNIQVSEDNRVTFEKDQGLIPPTPPLQGGNIQVSEDNRVTSEKDQGLIHPTPPLQGGDKTASEDNRVSSEKDQGLIPPTPPLQGGNIQVSEDNRVSSEKEHYLILPNLPLQGGNDKVSENNPPYEGGQGGWKFDKGWLLKRGLILGGYHLPYNPKLIKRAKEFRKNLTEAEKKIWYEFLRNHQLRFLRQRPIDNYIVDFYCASAKLVLEIDGERHLQVNNVDYDLERSTILENIYGLKVLRFFNIDVINNFETVCESINKIIEERKKLIPPNTLMQGGNDKVSEDNKVSSEKNQDLIPPNPPLKGGNDKVSESNSPYEGRQAGFALGLHVPKFHSKIINIEKCFLQSELSNAILNFTREYFKKRNISVYSTKTQSGFLRFLIIRECKNTNDLMINLITYDYNPGLMKEYSEKLKINFKKITTIINSVSQKKAQVATGENEYILLGNGFITEKLKQASGEEIIFKISPQSFFQTNTLQAEKLFNVLVEFAEFKKSDTVLDLYCGAGSISLFISYLVNNVFGVELVEDAINDARNNSKLNNIDNVEFICSDIKDYLENQNVITHFNKLILDPPRSGLHPKICEILSLTNFEKIVYVSCNPHTQARDLQIICGKENYIIEKIQPVDMFPHTYHIENVVSLIKQ
ncbi:MAG: 23S rRNA (uracil(1939)-C(5))-methyltransferase RlmD [Bacteroidota bacterium]|nr:23S rRNA (uracil(1939)-C(5))-methyltransferase RlmD [Bacteroidota bacterium]